jgi:phosphoglycerol transferase MdoB-like AlkP superfamily enzyme
MWWPILVFAVPLITLMKPFLPLAASTTLLIQGFACSYIAMLMSRDKLDLGIAGIVGVVLWRFGAAYALGVGIVLWVILMLGSDEPTVTAQKEK